MGTLPVGRSDRFSTAVAWLAVPWKELPLAVALIAAAAAPAFLVAMSGIWEDAAGDEIAVHLADAGPTSDRVIAIESPAFFEASIVDRADLVVRAALDPIDGYADSTRTLLSIPSGRGDMLHLDRTVNPDTVNPDDDDTRGPNGGASINIAMRLVDHPNAIESITVVDQLDSPGDDPTPGVWISEWVATDQALDVGDQLVSGECDGAAPDQPCSGVLPREPITIVGIYQTLWDTERSSDSWDVIPGLDPSILPRWVGPFGVPNYAMLLTTDGLLDDLQIPGDVRWSVEMDRPITGTTDLAARVAALRSIESALLNNRSISDPLAVLSGRAGQATATTTLPSTLTTTRRAQATLDQPFGSATAAGIAMGLAAMAAAAAFSVSRRAKEFRLLAGEGDRWPDFARRAAAQLVIPTAFGAALGVGAALMVGNFGAGTERSVPDRTASLGSVDVTLVVIVALAGVALGAAITGFLGQRALGDRPSLTTPETSGAMLFILLAVAALLWVQVARTGTRTARQPAEVDVAVIALPLAVLVAAVAVSMVLLRFAIGRLDPLANRLPPVPLLAWRRVSNPDGGGHLVMGSLAVALGLATFTTSLVDSLESAVELKLATELGSDTVVELVGRYPDEVTLPDGTTMVGLEQSRTQPGDQPVQIVAIDPATFVDAVAWPSEYPLTANEAVALLLSDVGDAVPVIALDDQTLANRGVFGLLDPVRYEVVATVPSIPLASSTRASLLVASDRIDDFVSARDEQVGGAGTPPSDRYRRRLLSTQPAETLEIFLDDSDLRQLGISTTTERRADASFIAPRYTFGYLRWFGVVAALGSLVALVFYLSSRRTRRTLSAIMLRRMGLSPGKAALVTSLEVMVITVAGAATSLAVSPSITERLLPRFDPAPTVPPTIQAAFPLATSLTVLGVGTTILAAIVWLIERRAMTRPEGPLLRGIE